MAISAPVRYGKLEQEPEQAGSHRRYARLVVEIVGGRRSRQASSDFFSWRCRVARRPIRASCSACRLTRNRLRRPRPKPPTNPSCCRVLAAAARPHDHHRDLRSRLPGKAPPHARDNSGQHRHLMMPSPAIHQPSDAHHSGWLSAGTAPAYRGWLNQSAVALPILFGSARSLRSVRHAREAKRSRHEFRSNLA